MRTILLAGFFLLIAAVDGVAQRSRLSITVGPPSVTYDGTDPKFTVGMYENGTGEGGYFWVFAPGLDGLIETSSNYINVYRNATFTVNLHSRNVPPGVYTMQVQSYYDSVYGERAGHYDVTLKINAPRAGIREAVSANSVATTEISITPNPATDGVDFRFAAGPGHFTAALYNSRGEEVAELYDGEIESGEKLVHCSTAGLAAGAYFVRGTAGGIVAVKPMMILR